MPVHLAPLALLTVLLLWCTACDRASVAATSPPSPPPLVDPATCAYLDEGPAPERGYPIHVHDAGPLAPPAAIDPEGRYIAVSRPDGVSVFSLAWGRERYRVRDSAPHHWTWLGPGRLAYRTREGELVSLDLNRATWSTLDSEPIPAHARTNPAAGLVAWLNPSHCRDPLGCEFELMWGRLDGPLRQTALGHPPWMSTKLEWVGRDGNVVVAPTSSHHQHRGRKFLTGANGTERVRLSAELDETMVSETWMSIHQFDRFILAHADPDDGWVRVHELDNGPPQIFAEGSSFTAVRSRPVFGPEPLAIDHDNETLAWLNGSLLHLTDLDTGDFTETRSFSREIAAAVFTGADCGLVVATATHGGLNFLPTPSAPDTDRARGLSPTRVRLLGGSRKGTLELVVGGRYARWSGEGLQHQPTFDDARLEGRWRISSRADGPELHGRANEDRLQLRWPDLGAQQKAVGRGIRVSPDGRWAALTSIADDATGLIEVHDLSNERVLGSHRVAAGLTALALTNDQLWLVVQSGHRATLTSHDLRSAEIRHSWSPETLPAPIIGLAVDPGSSSIYALVAGQSRIWRWSMEGQLGAQLTFHTEPVLSAEPPDCPCGREGRRLRLSKTGEEIIIETDRAELVRTTDGASLIEADQLTFAREPGVVLARDGERITAWTDDASTQLWAFHAYAGGEWVWWDPEGLRAHSPGSSDMIAPKLELRSEPMGRAEQ